MPNGRESPTWYNDLVAKLMKTPTCHKVSFPGKSAQPISEEDTKQLCHNLSNLIAPKIKIFFKSVRHLQLFCNSFILNKIPVWLFYRTSNSRIWAVFVTVIFCQIHRFWTCATRKDELVNFRLQISPKKYFTREN